jgi:hypothetical protein
MKGLKKEGIKNRKKHFLVCDDGRKTTFRGTILVDDYQTRSSLSQ